jgi:hypothetical protein
MEKLFDQLDQYIEFFINEFSKNTLEIVVKDTISDNTGTITLWSFELIFNKSFHVDESNLEERNQNYLKTLEKNKKEFYDELDKLINSGVSLNILQNKLNSFKLRLVEFLSCFFEEEVNYYGEKQFFIKNKALVESKNNIKSIFYPRKNKLLHSFLSVQKEILENLSNYLVGKITMLEHLNLKTMVIDPQNALDTSTIKWNKSKIDLIELITALVETKSILKDNKPITKENLVRLFSESFNIDLSDFEKDLNQAKKRKKEKAPFLKSLSEEFTNYCSKTR